MAATITLNQNGATSSGTTVLYGKAGAPSAGQMWCTCFFTDSACRNEVFSIPVLPTRTGYKFNGYYTASSGGTQRVPSHGSLLDTSCLSIRSAVTWYAQWSKLSYTLTLDKQSGSGGTSSLYYKIGTAGKWWSNSACTTEATSVTVPTRSGYVFCGYYNAKNGSGTKYINADGSFATALASLSLSADKTIYAYWQPIHKVTVDARGGTVGTSAFYYYPTDGKFYDSTSRDNELEKIAIPERQGYQFLGCTLTDGGTDYVIGNDGTISTQWAPTAAVTVYAQWRAVYTVTLDKQGGGDGTNFITYDTADHQFHPASSAEVIDRVDIPALKCHRFLGYYSAASGGTQYIDGSGNLLPALYQRTITADFTIYAHWSRVSYEMALDSAGGETATESVFCDISENTYYEDDLLQVEVTSVPVLVRTGHTFLGYFTASTGGTQVINAAGLITRSTKLTQDETAYAQWEVKVETLVFDYNGGTGSMASKQVTYGQPIGTLPTASRVRASFVGWFIDGVQVTALTPFTFNSLVAVAQWNLQFGGVTDWFGFASNALRPISSDSGDNRQRICVSHTGRWEPNVGETSGVWRNPTVTYQVVRDASINITLGKAFGGGSGISGYMITGVKVSTAIGKFPTITVTATANEGRDAINLFNLTMSLLGRARAQNLMGAVSGGGQLQSCNLQASCTPVVIAENNMPCASDVVGGRLSVDATTYAPNAESGPTAGGGFIEVGAPKQCGDKSYLAWKIKAERDM